MIVARLRLSKAAAISGINTRNENPAAAFTVILSPGDQGDKERATMTDKTGSRLAVR